jgi:hypothetical protein
MDIFDDISIKFEAILDEEYKEYPELVTVSKKTILEEVSKRLYDKMLGYDIHSMVKLIDYVELVFNSTIDTRIYNISYSEFLNIVDAAVVFLQKDMFFPYQVYVSLMILYSERLVPLQVHYNKITDGDLTIDKIINDALDRIPKSILANKIDTLYEYYSKKADTENSHEYSDMVDNIIKIRSKLLPNH